MFLISFDPLQHLQDDIEDLKSHLLVLGRKSPSQVDAQNHKLC